MINANRIVPVMKTDLISLYSVILMQASGNSSLAKLEADNVEGDFQIKTNSAVLIADQPVRSIDFDATASSVSAGTVYFVAAYDYEGFTIDGVAEEPADGSVDVEPDDSTLYKAVLAS